MHDAGTFDEVRDYCSVAGFAPAFNKIETIMENELLLPFIRGSDEHEARIFGCSLETMAPELLASCRERFITKNGLQAAS